MSKKGNLSTSINPRTKPPPKAQQPNPQSKASLLKKEKEERKALASAKRKATIAKRLENPISLSTDFTMGHSETAEELYPEQYEIEKEIQIRLNEMRPIFRTKESQVQYFHELDDKLRTLLPSIRDKHPSEPEAPNIQAIRNEIVVLQRLMNEEQTPQPHEQQLTTTALLGLRQPQSISVSELLGYVSPSQLDPIPSPHRQHPEPLERIPTSRERLLPQRQRIPQRLRLPQPTHQAQTTTVRQLQERQRQAQQPQEIPDMEQIRQLQQMENDDDDEQPNNAPFNAFTQTDRQSLEKLMSNPSNNMLNALKITGTPQLYPLAEFFKLVMGQNQVEKSPQIQNIDDDVVLPTTVNYYAVFGNIPYKKSVNLNLTPVQLEQLTPFININYVKRFDTKPKFISSNFIVSKDGFNQVVNMLKLKKEPESIKILSVVSNSKNKTYINT